MKRSNDNERDTKPKRSAPEDEYSRWIHQDWEDKIGKKPFHTGKHFVTVAVKKSQVDRNEHMDEYAAEDQIIAASSGFARIVLITTKSHYPFCDEAGREPHDGLGIYFDRPLIMDIKDEPSICLQLTINGTEIDLEHDSHANLSSWLFTNKRGNMTYANPRETSKDDTVWQWTFNCIELSSLDMHTADLYSATMHQYVAKSSDYITSERNKN